MSYAIQHHLIGFGLWVCPMVAFLVIHSVFQQGASWWWLLLALAVSIAFHVLLDRYVWLEWLRLLETAA